MSQSHELKTKIKELVEILEKLFSDPFIKYDITYCKHRYNFTEPIYQEDKDRFSKQREQLIKAMIKKAINKYIDNHYKWNDILAKGDTEEEYNDTSFNFIDDMILSHPTDIAISVPVGEKYEIGIDEIDRSLHLERIEEEDIIPGELNMLKKDDLVLKRPKHCKCWFQETEATEKCEDNCREKVKGTENVVSENK
jgi:hypothetical protein